MIKKVLIFLGIISGTQAMGISQSSIHGFTIQKLNSNDLLDFSAYKGKKILIVNVASKCGFTYQYKGLEELYQTYKSSLVVIGVPCNQFLNQEPRNEEKIAEFCAINYGVTFPITTKIKVKGKDQHPIYSWLTKKALNGKSDYNISWNFNKFLIDEEGRIIDFFGSKVKPKDEKIIQHLR